MNIQFITEQNPYFQKVMLLGKKHSATLGFMPDGGFSDHARKKWILVALKGSEFAGYLMFRVVPRKSRISIVHLCVKEEFRGHNVSNLLLNSLRQKYEKQYAGISLSCRADYTHASLLWQKFGFVCKGRERSRSIEENYLNKWWYDFNMTDLFSLLESQSDKIKAILDANIIMKLSDNQNLLESASDPRPLLADWLVSEVDYYYAPEILNEIVRDRNTQRAQRTRRFVHNFSEPRFNREECKLVANSLKLFISGDTENHNSDRIQLATAIVSDITYFITLDQGIIDVRDKIEKEYDVQIFRPQEFIIQIDQLFNKNDYEPVRLSGLTFHTISKVTHEEIETYSDYFLFKTKSEKKSDFRNKVLEATVDPISIKTEVIKSNNTPIAFFAYNNIDDTLTVKFIRISDTELQQTLFMQLITHFIKLSISSNTIFVKIEENYLSENQEKVLIRFGFEKADGIWKKVVIHKLIDSKQILLEIKPLLSEQIVDVFSSVNIVQDLTQRNKLLFDLERKLYPLKFSDLDIPCYIIPIKPYWAGQLFDTNISNLSIFGADPNKIWNRENVYYRNTRPITEIAPARILWYVSDDGKSQRRKAIVASSYLDKVMTGNPKKLFQMNKHYGIYEWRDIFKLCNGNIDNEIRALLFSETELFQIPISLTKTQEIFQSNGRRKNTFASPVRVDHCIFNEIYKQGTWKE